MTVEAWRPPQQTIPTPARRTVGVVTFGGLMGDQIRVNAIRSFLRAHHVSFRDYVLPHERPAIDIRREILWPGGLKHLTRKIVGRAPVSLQQELNWHIEVRQWEDSLSAGVAALRPAASEVAVLHAEMLHAGVVCARVKARLGIPFVYDMHGLFVEEARLCGSEEWVQASARWEREVVTAADRVIVVTPRMREYVRDVYAVDRDRILVCPNGTYLRDEVQPAFERPLKVVYAGNFAPYENVLLFARTAAVVSGADFRFVLVGDGSERDVIFNYVNANGVDLVYLGKKKHDRTMQLLGTMQVGFFGQPGDTPMTGSPIKLLDYATCGLPIIAGPGLWADPIRQFDCGVIVDALDPQRFADGLAQFRDRETWQRMSMNAKTMAREMYQWRDVLKPVAQLYAGDAIEQFHPAGRASR